MTLKEFFIETHPNEENDTARRFHIRPRIFCVDGFNLSIQANEGAYCAPRRILENKNETYYAAEIGYPSQAELLIIKFAEGLDYTNTVYPYVPTGIIEQVLEKHGGIDVEKTFQNER